MNQSRKGRNKGKGQQIQNTQKGTADGVITEYAPYGPSTG